MENIVDRFLRYVKCDTESCESSTTTPSTDTQLVFFDMIGQELKDLGIEDVVITNGYVMATIPSNVEGKYIPAVGFIAHVDTSPDLSGKGVNPQIIDSYDGGDIVLNDEFTMSVEDFPQLAGYKGQKLITTDGTTLLGADDKAGIAEIMYMAEYVMTHPEFKHGEIKIGFTPDEEIGRGVDSFDVERFDAKYAYTMDGSSLGELEYANFNAAAATIKIQGRSVHPGYAKNKMINAFSVARTIDNMVPAVERPEFTEGEEGFYHLVSLGGSVDNAQMVYIIRDHSMEIFDARKEKMQFIVDTVNKLYGREVATLEITDQYYNMSEIIAEYPEVVEVAQKAMNNIGITPDIKPIRGGTDGARLSFMGLPCPNVFAGGENFHGRYEFVSVDTMEKAGELILEILSVWAER